MEQLLDLLRELKPDIDFTKETKLVDSGILDSFTIVQLVGDLDDAFGITITPKELIPSNFNSAEAMWSMIQGLQVK
jgi:D-alanine--poly(phosphoribitol) ligase subunit 2